MRTILKILTVISVLSFSSIALAGISPDAKDARIEQIREREAAKIARIEDKFPEGAKRDAMIAKTKASANKLVERVENLPSES